MSSVLILTEAGRGIGMGHYTRCIAIRDAFQDEGVSVDMWVNFIEMSVDDPSIAEVDWATIADLPEQAAAYSQIIIDSYRADESIYEKLSQLASKLIIIDDYNRIEYQGDLIINPNVFYEDIDYSLQHVTHRGGADLVILREAFRESQIPAVKKKVENLLISIGGSDFRDLLPQLIQVFLRSAVSRITVIAPEGLTQSLKYPRLTVLGRQSTNEMVSLFSKADVVVSACGQSLHELAALGKPVIGICLDKDQVPNQQFYHKQGMLHQLINWDDMALPDLLFTNLHYLMDFEVRTGLIKLEPTLINKEGVHNIVQILLTLGDD